MAATIPDRYEPAVSPGSVADVPRPRPAQPWSPLFPPPAVPPIPPALSPTTSPPIRVRRPPSRRWLAAALAGAVLAGGASGGIVASAVTENSHNTGGIEAVTNTPATAGSLAKAAAIALPSVVSLTVATSGETDEGSGVVVSSDGLILTNNHVVALAATGGTITVTLSTGKSVRGSLVGRSVAEDVALVRVRGLSLTAAALSTSPLVVGQQVLAIGNSLGLSETVSAGIVSATNRDLTVSTGQDPFAGKSTEQLAGTVQTDAAINPGNSGGALVDINGRVIGLVTAAASLSDSASGSIGVGFAIPIGKALAVARTLANGV